MVSPYQQEARKARLALRALRRSMRLAWPASPAAKSPRPGVISASTKAGARAPLRTAWAERVTPLYVVVTMGFPIFISRHDCEAGSWRFVLAHD
jgi:hypothetical protein